MSDYTKQVSWSGKDALSDTDPNKVISGDDFDTEFSAVQTAVNSKIDDGGAAADIATDGLSGDKIDGGTISNFASTGIDDNATSTQVTVTDTGVNVAQDLTLTAAGDRYYVPRASDGAATGSLHSPTGNTMRLSAAGSSSGIVELESTTGKTFRLDSSGNVEIGSYSATGVSVGVKSNISTGPNVYSSATLTTAQWHYAFVNPNGFVGNISTSGSSTSYNTSSDYRLKEDWQPMAGATDRVKALKPVNFAWKADGKRVDGFLAHELAEVIPEAVTGTKDAMRDEEYEVTPAELDAEGNVITEAVMGTRSVPDMQGIDQSKVVPLLVATIQELTARIEALEA